MKPDNISRVQKQWFVHPNRGIEERYINIHHSNKKVYTLHV